MKPSAVFVDLTAAYDTVWHRGLTCKLLRVLLDKHMIRIIMDLVQKRRFTLTSGDSKQSRLCCLKNGASQGSILATLFCNICTYDLPSTLSRKLPERSFILFGVIQTLLVLLNHFSQPSNLTFD